MIPTMGYDPCKVNDVEKYFNKKDVQKAIHAYFPNMSDPYTLCRCLFWYIICIYFIANF